MCIGGCLGWYWCCGMFFGRHSNTGEALLTSLLLWGHISFLPIFPHSRHTGYFLCHYVGSYARKYYIYAFVYVRVIMLDYDIWVSYNFQLFNWSFFGAVCNGCCASRVGSCLFSFLTCTCRHFYFCMYVTCGMCMRILNCISLLPAWSVWNR